MFFLGQAANYRGKIFRHTFAFGFKKDYEALKKHLATRYQVPIENVFLYHNGRTALAAGMRAVVPKKNGEHPGILVTSLTCYAVVEAVKTAGFTPVFADIDPETYNIDPQSIREHITPKTKAVVAVDFTGQAVEVDKIRDICDKYNLIFVEDAAHSWQVKAARAEQAKPTIITNARTQSAEKAAKRKLSGRMRSNMP